MTAARSAALALKFALELGMLAALAYWEAQAGGSTASYAAPRSPSRLPRGPRVVLESCCFAVAAVALAGAGAPVPAAAFAVLVAIDTALLLRWEAPERTGPGG